MKKWHVAAFILGILFIEALAHLDVYFVLIEILQISSKAILLPLQILFGILFISFISALLISAKFNNLAAWTYYQFASVWLGFFLYFFIASCLYGLLAVFIPLTELRLVGIILFCSAILTALYGFYSALSIKTKRLKIKLTNLPLAWLNKSVVFVSDFHLGHINRENFALKIAEKINNINPDYIFIGGDLYDGLKVDTDRIIAPLKNLKALNRTYFVSGNHDGFSEDATERDLQAIEKIGIKILNDEVVDLLGIQLIGVSYKHGHGHAGLDQTLKNLSLDPSKPSILLKHVPDDIEVSAKNKIDLQLSGHTHKAQSWPLTYIPFLLYGKFAHGLNSFNQTQVYTSSGAETWGPPMRIGSSSEIVVINFTA